MFLQIKVKPWQPTSREKKQLKESATILR